MSDLHAHPSGAEAGQYSSPEAKAMADWLEVVKQHGDVPVVIQFIIDHYEGGVIRFHQTLSSTVGAFKRPIEVLQFCDDPVITLELDLWNLDFPEHVTDLSVKIQDKDDHTWKVKFQVPEHQYFDLWEKFVLEGRTGATTPWKKVHMKVVFDARLLDPNRQEA